VPYVPAQAALEDKGKTPVLARLVVATTNCADLNASEYFYCPYAVRRRLPFVVNVQAKPELQQTNGSAIDPRKIEVKNGTYPDLWVLTVKKLIPVASAGREFARTETVATFTDINKFLAYFGKHAMQHRANQARALRANDGMKGITVCKVCFKPNPHKCEMLPPQLRVQNDDEPDDVPYFYADEEVKVEDEDDVDDSPPFYTRWFQAYVEWCIQWNVMWTLIRWASYFRATRHILGLFANWTGVTKFQLKLYGMYANLKQDKVAKRIAIGCTVFGAALVAYKLYYHFKSEKEEKVVKSEKPTIETAEVKIEFDEQGNLHGTTEDQLLKEESRNVWYNPQVPLSSFDIPKASGSLAKKTHNELRGIFGNNCVLLQIKVVGEPMRRTMRGVFWRGHQCITNAHAFKDDGYHFEVTVVRSNNHFSVNSNITFTITRDDVSFSDETDLCMFEVNGLPPFRDISPFWADKNLVWSSGLEIIRQEDGTLINNPIFALKRDMCFPVESLGRNYDVVTGASTIETESGMCGSLLIATTPRGAVLAGLHFLGKDRHIGFVVIQREQIEKLCHHACISKRPVVQAGDGPKLSCSTRTHALTELHHKSIVRYFDEAHLNVYGSFVGFRPRPTSKVCPTPLHDEFLAIYNVENNYGKPSMRGYEPWRKNVIEMVKPISTYNKAILRECVDGYVRDILHGLPQDWERELVILSDMAAVNGLPGVKYIDAISKGTSMGHPWSKTKKEFLFSAKSEKHPDGVDFEPEIWERVRAIEATYEEGKRAYPVFTGHLKDEATPLRKCKIHKTRLFTGAPIDWSLVVRKYLLSFVRLVQKNKIVFEAGPGTVTQSAEWGLIHEYLTQFGEDRMIAGDFGKYDKRMISDFVLAAFDCIQRIHRAAGFSETECRLIMCIGEDTAFPLSDINGDLLEFYGTNPSGHPLTVIINSLVNSLYNRYCYRVLNPAQEVRTFKQNVALFTYGDDNVMGVSLNAEFFNHTANAAVLASIGVEYTMADKESESRPYIFMDEVSFLKRMWVWETEIDNWAAPLDETSIVKSLTMWVPSESLDKYAQMVHVIASANNEYFFYGRKKYEEMQQIFQGLLAQHPYCEYVTKSTLPTYDELVERFHRSSVGLSA